MKSLIAMNLPHVDEVLRLSGMLAEECSSTCARPKPVTAKSAPVLRQLGENDRGNVNAAFALLSPKES